MSCATMFLWYCIPLLHINPSKIHQCFGLSLNECGGKKSSPVNVRLKLFFILLSIMHYLIKEIQWIMLLSFRYNLGTSWGRALWPLHWHLGFDVSCFKICDKLYGHSLFWKALCYWIVCSEVQRPDHAVLQPCHR